MHSRLREKLPRVNTAKEVSISMKTRYPYVWFDISLVHVAFRYEWQEGVFYVSNSNVLAGEGTEGILKGGIRAVCKAEESMTLKEHKKEGTLSNSVTGEKYALGSRDLE